MVHSPLLLEKCKLLVLLDHALRCHETREQNVGFSCASKALHALNAYSSPDPQTSWDPLVSFYPKSCSHCLGLNS